MNERPANTDVFDGLAPLVPPRQPAAGRAESTRLGPDPARSQPARTGPDPARSQPTTGVLP